MSKYSWSMNETKLQRAEAQSKTGTEEDIQSIYVSLGGKLSGNDTPMEPIETETEPETEPEVVVETTGTDEVAIESDVTSTDDIGTDTEPDTAAE